MTTTPDGTTTCDRCGGDAGNGGVSQAVVISDLDFAAGRVVNLHFCRAPQGKNGTAKTCADIVVTTATAAAKAGRLEYPRSQHAAQSESDAIAQGKR